MGDFYEQKSKLVLISCQVGFVVKQAKYEVAKQAKYRGCGNDLKVRMPLTRKILSKTRRILRHEPLVEWQMLAVDWGWVVLAV